MSVNKFSFLIVLSHLIILAFMTSQFNFSFVPSLLKVEAGSKNGKYKVAQSKGATGDDPTKSTTLQGQGSFRRVDDAPHPDNDESEERPPDTFHNVEQQQLGPEDTGEEDRDTADESDKAKTRSHKENDEPAQAPSEVEANKLSTGSAEVDGDALENRSEENDKNEEKKEDKVEEMEQIRLDGEERESSALSHGTGETERLGEEDGRLAEAERKKSEAEEQSQPKIDSLERPKKTDEEKNAAGAAKAERIDGEREEVASDGESGPFSMVGQDSGKAVDGGNNVTERVGETYLVQNVRSSVFPKTY